MAPAPDRRQNLTKHFGNFMAVDDVSFSVQPGEVFGWLGPNGAGKTTTIRMLLGLLKPTSGSTLRAGLRLRPRRPRPCTAQVGYMSQQFTLYNDLTAREHPLLRHGLRPVAATSCASGRPRSCRWPGWKGARTC